MAAGGQSIDRASDRPTYKQIADHLRALIAEGKVPPGEALPSESALMAQYGTARGTVRQAINVLKAEGLIQVEHGRGSFVRTSPPSTRLGLERFARRGRERGQPSVAELQDEERQATAEILGLGRGAAPPEIAARLGLADGAPVLIRRERHLADDKPVELATSYVPWGLAKGTAMVRRDPGPGGIYARLEEGGHGLKRFSEDVASRMPTPAEAQLLELRSGVPVFRLLRTAYDTEGEPVEVCDTVMAADRYILSYELPAG